MKKSLFALLLALQPSLLFAQAAATPVTLTTTTCPGAGCTSIQVNRQGGLGIQVTGTFVGTLTFSGSLDGTNFVALPMIPIAGGATVTTATAAGIWTASIAGLSVIQVAFTSFSSGSALVSSVLSQARAVPALGTIVGGTCTNQDVTAISAAGVPTCSTVTSAKVDTSIALTGTDINTSNQVTATHLAAALPVAQGGLGAATETIHGVLLGQTTGPVTATAAGATNTVLHGNTGADPTYSAIVNGDITNTTIDLTTKVTGTLPVGNGGIGLATLTAHALYVGNGTSAPNAVAVCSTGTYVRGATGADPTCSTLVLPNSATQGDLLVATSANTVGSLAGVAAGSLLRSAGTSTAPAYTTATFPTTTAAGQYLISTTTNAVIAVAPAWMTAQPANQTDNATATFKMNGLGAAAAPCTITPVATGRVRFVIYGSVANNTSGDAVTYKLAYGTGTAPANSAALTGTIASATQTFTDLTGLTTNGVPFSVEGIATGLALATAVWFDLQIADVTGGTAVALNVTCNAVEG